MKIKKSPFPKKEKHYNKICDTNQNRLFQKGKNIKTKFVTQMKHRIHNLKSVFKINRPFLTQFFK